MGTHKQKLMIHKNVLMRMDIYYLFQQVSKLSMDSTTDVQYSIL